MFSIFKRHEVADSDVKLKQIIDLLFPQFETKVTDEGLKYAIDSSIDTNIDAVVTDLQDGYLDNTCINTLEACLQRIQKVREILNPRQIMNPDIEKYILSVDKNELDLNQYSPAIENE
jgi:hypothetical protein